VHKFLLLYVKRGRGVEEVCYRTSPGRLAKNLFSPLMPRLHAVTKVLSLGVQQTEVDGCRIFLDVLSDDCGAFLCTCGVV
jgi:hypothetical protein